MRRLDKAFTAKVLGLYSESDMGPVEGFEENEVAQAVSGPFQKPGL